MQKVASKHYLLGAKLSFLIISFVLLIIAVTVNNDIWPFLQKNIPVHADQESWFVASIFFGFISPVYWLSFDWNNRALRYSLVSLAGMYVLQLLTEAIVGQYFFISMIIPTSILYVGYRIIQLINLQSTLYKTINEPKEKFFRTLVVLLTLLFWSVVWIKLTFVVFPGIIEDIF